MKVMPALSMLLAVVIGQSASAQVAVPPPLTARVEVFTNSSILLKSTEGAKIYYLDGLMQLEDQLSQGLPADADQASIIVRQRAKALGRALQERAMNAGEGMTRAAYYGVNRVPAVVFNGQAVVYGVTDIAQARALYTQSVARRIPARRTP